MFEDLEPDAGSCAASGSPDRALSSASTIADVKFDLVYPAGTGITKVVAGVGSAITVGSGVRLLDIDGTPREGIFVIGTSEKTACTGDSGAPVLAATGEVIGVVHGTTGRFCASPADVVPLAANRDWLLAWLPAQVETGSASPRTVLLAALALAVLGWILARRRLTRNDAPERRAGVD